MSLMGALIETLFLGVANVLVKIILVVAFVILFLLIFGAGYTIFEIIKGNKKIGLLLISALVFCLSLSKITENIGGIILFILIIFGVLFFRLGSFIFKKFKK